MGTNARLEREVAALGGLSREDLARRWEKSYGCPPPKGLKRGLLERAAVWQLQARILGGLSPETRRALKAVNCDRIITRWEAHAKDEAELIACGIATTESGCATGDAIREAAE